MGAAFLLLGILSSCGGGGGGGDDSVTEPPPAPPVVSTSCGSVSIRENGVCRLFAIRFDERVPTPFVENGQAVTLEAVVFKPLVGTRFPTIVVHRGSTGDGTDPSSFIRTFTNKSITNFFVDRGWMVIFPQRRGRGSSGGLYDEGLNANRSAYTCERSIALAGAEHALDDLDVLTDWVRNRSDVDTSYDC